MIDGATTIAAIVAIIAMSGIGAALAWRATLPPGGDDRDPASAGRLAVLAYLAFHAAGSIVLLATGESAGAGPLLAASAILAFGIGSAAARRSLGPDPAVEPTTRAGFRPVAVVALAALGLAAITPLVAVNGIPLLAADPQASRTGFAGLLFDLFRWLVPPGAVLAVAVAVASGQQRDWMIAASALVGVAGLEVLLASRALPLELGIAALLVTWWAGRRPSGRAWIAMTGVAGVLFVGVLLVRVTPEGSYRGPADAAAFAVRRTIDRVVLIHPRTLEVVASEIPASEPYFGGSTYVRRLSMLLGAEERPSLGYWLYGRLFPGETGGFAAPGVAGEAWANGGPLILAVVMGGLGALAAWLGRGLARLGGGPADRAFAAIVTVAVARTYATSLNGFALTLVAATAWWLVASGRVGTTVGRIVEVGRLRWRGAR